VGTKARLAKLGHSAWVGLGGLALAGCSELIGTAPVVDGGPGGDAVSVRDATDGEAASDAVFEASVGQDGAAPSPDAAGTTVLGGDGATEGNGEDASPSDSLDASNADGTFGPSPCEACIAQSCAAELTACTADPDCENNWSCMQTCPLDPDGGPLDACVQACPAGTTSSGMAAEATLQQCMIYGAGQYCTACGGSPSPAQTVLQQQCPPPTSYANACDQCQQTYCCNSAQTCANDPACALYANCVVMCPMAPADGTGSATDAGTLDDGAVITPATCEEACNEQYPGGRGDWAALSACDVVYCSSADACDAMPTDCLQCIIDTCPDAYVDYEGSSEGLALSFCIDACSPTDTTCLGYCYVQYPSALSAASDVNTCALSQCAACQP
jgi:hypothetical protein